MLTERYVSALQLAMRLHHGHMRKGTPVPYIAHLLATSSIALEYGGDENEAIAALLHDAIEDRPEGGQTAESIERLFGADVLQIVLGCSDATDHPKPPWQARKERFVERMRHASPAVLLVSAADKLHNARSLTADYREHGEALFERFNAGKSDTLWYYRAVVDAMGEGLGRVAAGDRPLLAKLIVELERSVEALERECGILPLLDH